MHVVDRRLLLAHLEGEYVADRDHAGKAALAHDGQMADTLPRHHRGAFLDRRVGRAGRDRRRHDVRHLGRGGIAPPPRHPPQEVPPRGKAHPPPPPRPPQPPHAPPPPAPRRPWPRVPPPPPGERPPPSGQQS